MWIPVIGLTFSAPMLALGIFGLVEEVTKHGQSRSADFVFGITLATAFLLTSLATFFIPIFASRWFYARWLPVLLRLFSFSLASTIPLALSISYSQFNQKEYLANPGKMIFIIGFLFIVALLFLGLFFFLYFLIPFSMARWRLKKVTRAFLSEAPIPPVGSDSGPRG